ncbi:MAG: RsmB/NOP family class I SAM-dependent RNA methyltransferase, partial [Acidimicrobiia bacterium]
LAEADRRFVTELVYGTTRMRRACDVALEPYVLRELDVPTRAALRLGAYQLLVLGTPPHAAVSATVAAVPPRTRGLVNAVLRRLAGTPPIWPDDASRLSYPDWIVERLVADLGPTDATGALERMNVAPSVREREDGYVQDLASQWVADAVDAAGAARVLDVCAAPGGKASAMAAARSGDDWPVVACDVRPARASLTATNMARIGARVVTCGADGTQLPFADGRFDRVLVDAPCSGLGTLRRRPDARWRIDPDAPARLAAQQHRLVDEAVRVLAPGGMLVYSVCTLSAVETLGVDQHLAAAHPELAVPEGPPLPGGPWRALGRGALLLPQAADTDGMYVLRLCRS